MNFLDILKFYIENVYDFTTIAVYLLIAFGFCILLKKKKPDKKEIIRLSLIFLISFSILTVESFLMFSLSYVSTRYAGASLSINGILRDEFGFTGTAITDAGGQKNTYMTTDFMLRRGGDLTLTNNGTDGLYDTTSPTAIYWLKMACKHILYNKANSNCVQGVSPSASISYGLSSWRIGLYVTWGVVAILLAADIAVIAVIALDKIHIKEKEQTESAEEY